MPNSEDGEPPADVNSPYLTLFSEQLDDFRSHLSGRVGGDPLSASYFAPHAFWSAAEKDAFFRGLAMHSRLRPDLIAEEVKTKTIPDVCVYIAMLEQAERDMLKGIHYVDETCRPVKTKIPRKNLPAALEVSENWITFEERMASAILTSQPAFDQNTVIKEREDEIQTRRMTVKAKRGGARTASNERDREGEKGRREDFEKWLVQKKSDWEGEDLLLSLDRDGLTALDRMLRDDEEGRGIVLEADGYHSEVEALAVPNPSGRGDTTPSRPDGVCAFGIADGLIDPVLLEISRAGSSPAPTQETDAVSGISHIMQSPHRLPGSSQPPPLSQFQPATPPFTPVSIPDFSDETPFTPAASSAPSGRTEEGSQEDLSQMSPVSRRRAQKRLYMRRKRALAAGTVAVENTERLKPGRKPKKRPPTRLSTKPPMGNLLSVLKAPSTDGHVIDGSDPPERSGHTGVKYVESREVGVDQADYRHQKISGKTPAYRRQFEFLSKGVDVQRLRREGLDLFHLQAIPKLMQTYNQLQEAPSDIGSEISGETLRVLRALVVTFVAEVMSRAIVWREQERIAKLQTKIWHLRDNQVISAANVKQALALYGADRLNKRAHFAELLAKLEVAENDDESDDEDIEEDVPLTPAIEMLTDADHGQDPQGDDDELKELPLKPLPLARMIFPPFSNAPSSGLHHGDIPGSLDPSVYMPWPSSSLLSTSPEPPHDEELLPEEIDERALVGEVVEDNEIDKDDHLRDVEEENALWARVGGQSCCTLGNSAPRVIHANVGGTSTPPPQKRKRPDNVSVQESGAKDRALDRSEGSGRRTNTDVDEVEIVVTKRTRRKKGTGHLSEKQLMFAEPDPDGRIKSSVYVLDSD